MRGGVIGGSIVRGEFKVGDEIEIDRGEKSSRDLKPGGSLSKQP